MNLQTSLGEIVAALGGELRGEAGQRIAGIAPLEAASSEHISFLAHPKYRAQLASTRAGAVIVTEALGDEAARRGAAVVVPDAYHYFARLTQWWAERVRPRAQPGVHASAVVHPSARLGQRVTIGPLVVVESDAVIGDDVVIGPHAVVGRGATIGAGTRLSSGVHIGFECHVGQRCLLHSGVVIGADGFGFAPCEGRWEKIEQLGAVRIGDDVEIGANSCVDRGALGDTVLSDGVKLDNLVQIGHNVQVGRHVAMAGCAGVAGSAVIGDHCTVGGGGMVLGHLTLAEGVNVSAATLVSRSIHKPGLYSGVFPFDDNASWEKNAATLRQLYALRERVRALEKQLKQHDGHSQDS